MAEAVGERVRSAATGRTVYGTGSLTAPDRARKVNIQTLFTNNRISVARFVFSLDAVLGILGIGGAALYVAALSSEQVWTTFLAIFVPFAVLWASFCYCAYKGLTSKKAILRIVFWVYVVGNIVGFPVGTAIAGVSIWLWHELKKQNICPVSA